MKERILMIMEKEGLTSSRFAEAIGIQRSAMSHIISGRNNPSLDVVTKILERFPYIDSDWLLLGKGNMCKSNENKISDPTLFNENSINPPKVQMETEYRKETGVQKPVYNNELPEKEKIILQEKPAKNISKIMVFYSDNTFDTFIPEKKSKD
ncbi:helix-turn-helix domain-containing protein [Parabacteroides pacaensis]|uniref:helix-turn-helix domain-containing protein n=1 Tax=Parabacteroides pacaensis TaxID=2086575 RepID=UPI0018FE5925|nr:helix-turn-helix transcriptional regulator [Parabacteroides pacaensis]